MKNNSFYNNEDYPSIKQRSDIWNSIEDKLPHNTKASIHFHWKSFWIGNAAAVLLVFSVIGLFTTLDNFFERSSTEEQVYATLNTATKQLQDLTPLLIRQANEQNKSSLESTAEAITEIDKLIEEIKNEININGSSPSKEASLKRLYATKLDFYKELLLNQEEQS